MKQKNKGNKFEDKIRKTINSGALWFSKGDMFSDTDCIECKYTDKQGFRITTKILEKIWEEALNQNKEPLLILGIKRNNKEIFTLYCKIQIHKK